MDPDLFRLNAAVEDRHWWFVGRRRILAHLLGTLLGDRAPALVADVGAGTGANTAALDAAPWCGLAVGVEPNRDAVRLAHARFPDLFFLTGDLDDARPLYRDVDAVVLADVLEHLPDPRWALARILEPLRPGSQVVLTVPRGLDLWSTHDVIHGHYTRYDADRLGALWRDQPVRTRLLSPFNARLYPVAAAVRCRERRRARPDATASAARTDLERTIPGINGILARVFAGERHALTRALDSGRPAFSHGLSLLAVLERTPGVVRVPEVRPAPPVPVDPRTPPVS